MVMVKSDFQFASWWNMGISQGQRCLEILPTPGFIGAGYKGDVAMKIRVGVEYIQMY